MIDTTAHGPLAIVHKARSVLDATPYSALALIARAATFSVFFRSGLQKLSDWNSTLRQTSRAAPASALRRARYLSGSSRPMKNS